MQAKSSKMTHLCQLKHDFAESLCSSSLFTIDLDFANLLDYPPQNYQGIMLLRYQVEQEAELDETLRICLNDLYRDALRRVLVIVSNRRYRVRHGEAS
jgi:hypothetical protein